MKWQGAMGCAPGVQTDRRTFRCARVLFGVLLWTGSAWGCQNPTGTPAAPALAKDLCIASWIRTSDPEPELPARDHFLNDLTTLAERCLDGSAAHCWAFAAAYSSTTAPTQLQYDDAVVRACVGGVRAACVILGQREQLPTSDECRREVRHRVATLWDFSEPTVARLDPDSPSYMRDVLEAACAIEDARACAQAARIWSGMRYGSLEAVQLHDRACVLGELRSCVEIGEGSATGLLDRARAEALAGATTRRGEVDLEVAGRRLSSIRGEVDAPDRMPLHNVSDLVEPTTPSLSADQIRTVVRGHFPELRACFEAALLDDPNLHGTVSIRFIIGGDGQVITSVVVTSPPNHEAFAECVRTAVLGWQFPAPEGGGLVSVTYPFTFEAT